MNSFLLRLKALILSTASRKSLFLILFSLFLSTPTVRPLVQALESPEAQAVENKTLEIAAEAAGAGAAVVLGKINKILPNTNSTDNTDSTDHTNHKTGGSIKVRHDERFTTINNGKQELNPPDFQINGVPELVGTQATTNSTTINSGQGSTAAGTTTPTTTSSSSSSTRPSASTTSSTITTNPATTSTTTVSSMTSTTTATTDSVCKAGTQQNVVVQNPVGDQQDETETDQAITAYLNQPQASANGIRFRRGQRTNPPRTCYKKPKLTGFVAALGAFVNEINPLDEDYRNTKTVCSPEVSHEFHVDEILNGFGGYGIVVTTFLDQGEDLPINVLRHLLNRLDQATNDLNKYKEIQVVTTGIALKNFRQAIVNKIESATKAATVQNSVVVSASPSPQPNNNDPKKPRKQNDKKKPEQISGDKYGQSDKYEWDEDHFNCNGRNNNIAKPESLRKFSEDLVDRLGKAGKLFEKDNTIRVKINGKPFEIRAHLENGKLTKINGYPGTSSRLLGELIADQLIPENIELLGVIPAAFLASVTETQSTATPTEAQATARPTEPKSSTPVTPQKMTAPAEPKKTIDVSTLSSQPQKPTPITNATNQSSGQPVGFAWSTASGLSPMSEQQLKDLGKSFTDPSFVSVAQFNSATPPTTAQPKAKQDAHKATTTNVGGTKTTSNSQAQAATQQQAVFNNTLPLPSSTVPVNPIPVVTTPTATPTVPLIGSSTYTTSTFSAPAQISYKPISSADMTNCYNAVQQLHQADMRADALGLSRPSNDPKNQNYLRQIGNTLQQEQQRQAQGQGGQAQVQNQNHGLPYAQRSPDYELFYKIGSIFCCIGRIIKSPYDTARLILRNDNNPEPQTIELSYHTPLEDLYALRSTLTEDYALLKSSPFLTYGFYAATTDLTTLKDMALAIPKLAYLLSLPLKDISLIEDDAIQNEQSLTTLASMYDTATSALPNKAGAYLVKNLQFCAQKVMAADRERSTKAAKAMYLIASSSFSYNNSYEFFKNLLDESLAAFREAVPFAKQWEILRRTLDNPALRETKTFNLVEGGLFTKNPRNCFNMYGINNLDSFATYTGSPIQLSIHQKLVDFVNYGIRSFIDNFQSPCKPNKNFLTEKTIPLIINYLIIAKELNTANNFSLVFAIENFCTNLFNLDAKIDTIFQNANSNFQNTIGHLFSSTQSDQYYIDHFVETLHTGLQQQAPDNIVQIVETFQRQAPDEIDQDLDAAANQLAGIICLACANSPESRQRFLAHTTADQASPAQVADAAMDLVANILLQQTLQNNQQQSTQLLANLRQIITQEQVLLQKATRENYQHLNLYNPIATIFTQAIQRARPEVLKLPQNATTQQRPTPSTTTTATTTAPATTSTTTNTAATVTATTTTASAAKTPQASLNGIPRPLQSYVRLSANAEPATTEQATLLINQCDQENKTHTFSTPLSHNLPISQMPSLYQFYPALELKPEYGNDDFGLFCGYYAAYFAEVFAANPQALHEQLINLLNNRHDFEQHMLTQGKQVVHAFRGQRSDTNANLLGEEIVHILSNNTRLSTIVVGAVQQRRGINESQVQRTARLVDSFKKRRLQSMIWILQPEHQGHWITVLVRRNNNQTVEMIIADSIGMDRRNMQDIIEIYQTVTATDPVLTTTLAAATPTTTNSSSSSSSSQPSQPTVAATPGYHVEAQGDGWRLEAENDDAPSTSSTHPTTVSTSTQQTTTNSTPTTNIKRRKPRIKRSRDYAQLPQVDDLRHETYRRSSRLAEIRNRANAKRQREETDETKDKEPEKKTCRRPAEANEQ
jgi:hypothetical protein